MAIGTLPLATTAMVLAAAGCVALARRTCQPLTGVVLSGLAVFIVVVLTAPA